MRAGYSFFSNCYFSVSNKAFACLAILPIFIMANVAKCYIRKINFKRKLEFESVYVYVDINRISIKIVFIRESNYTNVCCRVIIKM